MVVGLAVPIPERVQNLPRTRRQDSAFFKKLAQSGSGDLNPQSGGDVTRTYFPFFYLGG